MLGLKRCTTSISCAQGHTLSQLNPLVLEHLSSPGCLPLILNLCAISMTPFLSFCPSLEHPTRFFIQPSTNEVTLQEFSSVGERREVGIESFIISLSESNDLSQHHLLTNSVFSTGLSSLESSDSSYFYSLYSAP